MSCVLFEKLDRIVYFYLKLIAVKDLSPECCNRLVTLEAP